MEELSAAERVRQVDDDHAVRRLRRWLRGDQHLEPADAEALDHSDLVGLARVLRQCVADGCLEAEAVRGVADLIMHAVVVHGSQRLGDGTVRAFGLLAAGVHGRNATAPAAVVTTAPAAYEHGHTDSGDHLITWPWLEEATEGEIVVPLCETGVGPDDGCPDLSYCATRKQPMCGGHTTVVVSTRLPGR